MELNVGLFDRRSFWPASEGLTKFGFHSGGIKITRYSKDDVIGMNVGVMPVDQILASHCRDSGILWNSRVGILRAISQFDRLARRDAADIIIPPGDVVVFSFLGDFDFVLAEFRLVKQVRNNFEYIVEVGF